MPIPTNSPPDLPILDDDAVAKVEARRARCLDNKNQSRLAEASILIASDIPALCETVRALRAENQKLHTMAEFGLRNAEIIDRIRAWSKCEDGYPLDEHINNITVDRERLRSSRRVHELDNHHNALACGYCAGLIKEEIARLQSQLEQVTKERDALLEAMNVALPATEQLK